MKNFEKFLVENFIVIGGGVPKNHKGVGGVKNGQKNNHVISEQPSSASRRHCDISFMSPTLSRDKFCLFLAKTYYNTIANNKELIKLYQNIGNFFVENSTR